MRLERLDLERFGHFRGPKLSFGRAPSLLLVHGNNEAGKTTVLQAIRWLLFGGGAWAMDDASPAVGARVELSNGSAMEIRRTKGRGGGLKGVIAGGDEIDEDWILARLTRPNRVVFENVFGFSLAGLAEGAKALEHANLRNVIYGGGLGGTVQPDTILKELRAEASELFTPAGRAQKIAVRLKRIDELQRKVKSASTRADEWRHLEEVVEDRTSIASRSRDAWRARTEEARRMASAIDAIQPLRRRDRALAEREILGELPILPADAATQHATWTSQRDALRASILELDEAIAAHDDTIARTHVDDVILRSGDEITAVARSLPRLLDDLEQHPRAVQELALLEQRVRESLRALRPDWDLDRLRRFEVDLIASKSFESACEELEAARAEVKTLTASLRQLDADLRDNQAERALLPAAVDVAPLRAWLESAGDVAAEKKNAQAAEARVVQIAKKRAALFAKLDPEPSDALRVPRAEDMLSFERERDALDDEASRVAEQLRARRDDVDALAANEKGARVATEKELAAARKKRDELLDELLDSKPTPARVRAHGRAVAAADAMADDMRAHADAVQRRAAYERAFAAVERVEAVAKDLAARRADHNKRWRALFSFEPGDPAEMLTWLERRDQLRALDEELASERERGASHQARVDEWLRRGRTLLNVPHDDELRSIASARVAAEDQRATRAHALDHRRARDLARHESTARDLDDAHKRVAAIVQRIPALLSAIGLEAELSPEAARLLMQSLVRVRTELVSGESSLRAQIARLASSIHELRTRADALIAALSASGPVDTAIPALERRLVVARDAARTRLEAERARSSLTGKRERARTQLNDTVARIDALYSAARVATEHELLAAIAANERHAALTRDLEADERLLAQLCGARDREAFLAEVRTVDPADLAALEADVKRLEQEMLAHERLVGDARAKLAAVDGRGDAAIALAELEAERAALHQEVERYAILTLSDALLTQAIERFERENQPALLHRASLVFAAMTAGRYTVIRKSGDGIVVERKTGDEVSPDVLSTGTREQLYLAIRLAYVEHYCASAEPLPVVLDDVLVNFDDHRARATLEALAAFSTRTQVILFTCHQSTMTLARDAALGAQTLEIPPV